MREIVQNNITLVSTMIFLVLFLLFNTVKPKFAYKANGEIRDFGINYKNKTIFPVWLIAVLLAICIYFFVMYYIAYPRINFNSLSI